ncbi:MAG: putative quinol monooxygenase [Chloroflexi bacterium]|nr:putative quinol monooxygenase [Chloroflexota bacterium]
MYAILAPVRLKSGVRDSFVSQLGDHARRSLAEEPDCLRFDVIQDANDRDTVWFYEVYTSAEAFAEHQKTDHYVEWIKIAMTLIAEFPSYGFEGGSTIYPIDKEWS